MTWKPERRWMPISQYRTIPLPIRPLPPMPKRLNMSRILKGLKQQKETKVDGIVTSKVVQQCELCGSRR